MIKTFSSRAGRLSSTNKNYLSLQSNCLISPETKPKTNYPIVIDIGFGDAQSFSEDVLINKKYCFEVKDMLVKEDFIVINGWASDEDLNIGKICVVFKPNNKSE